jgi:hypothetical protein
MKYYFIRDLQGNLFVSEPSKDTKHALEKVELLKLLHQALFILQSICNNNLAFYFIFLYFRQSNLSRKASMLK